MTFWDQCILLEPNNIEILINLANMCLLQNQTEKGANYLSNILKIDPNNQRAQILLFKLREEKEDITLW